MINMWDKQSSNLLKNTQSDSSLTFQKKNSCFHFQITCVSNDDVFEEICIRHDSKDLKNFCLWRSKFRCKRHTNVIRKKQHEISVPAALQTTFFWITHSLRNSALRTNRVIWFNLVIKSQKCHKNANKRIKYSNLMTSYSCL